MTTEEEAKDLVRELTERINDGSYDTLEEFFVDDYSERHDNDGETVSEIVEEERERAEAFAEKHEELDGILTDTDAEDGQHLNAWYTVTGTHEGEFISLPPTGNEVDFPLIRTIVVEDGLITRYRLVYSLGFLLNLGVNWPVLTDEVPIQEFQTRPEEIDV